MGMYTNKKYVDGIDCQAAKDGMTKQCFKDECNINVLLARYAKAEGFPVPDGPLAFGDVSLVVPFQEAMNVVVAAQEAFDALPAIVRDRFMNDPGRFVAFMSDANNLDEAVRLGLAVKRVEPAPAPAGDPPAGAGGLVAK